MSVSWGNQTSVSSFWTSSSSLGSGIDLRAEMMKILYGGNGNKAQGHKVLIRRADNVCPCMLEERGQRDREPNPTCSICHGLGFTFTDYLSTAWRSLVNSNSGSQVGTEVPADLGVTNAPGYNFFFDYLSTVKEDDRIIELRLGLDGSVPTNLGEINHLETFKIIQRIIMRDDGGRVTFVRAICEREQW